MNLTTEDRYNRSLKYLNIFQNEFKLAHDEYIKMLREEGDYISAVSDIYYEWKDYKIKNNKIYISLYERLNDCSWNIFLKMDCDVLELVNEFVDDDKCREIVTHFPNLEELILNDMPDITDKGIYYLSKLKNLKSLYIWAINMTDEGCKHIATMKNLRHLKFSYCQNITNKGIYHIRNMNLLFLDIRRNNIDNKSCEYIYNMKCLQYLNISNCFINDKGLRIISKMNTLSTLICGVTSIVADGVGTEAYIREKCGQINIQLLNDTPIKNLECYTYDQSEDYDDDGTPFYENDGITPCYDKIRKDIFGDNIIKYKEKLITTCNKNHTNYTESSRIYLNQYIIPDLANIICEYLFLENNSILM